MWKLSVNCCWDSCCWHFLLGLHLQEAQVCRLQLHCGCACNRLAVLLCAAFGQLRASAFSAGSACGPCDGQLLHR